MGIFLRIRACSLMCAGMCKRWQLVQLFCCKSWLTVQGGPTVKYLTDKLQFSVVSWASCLRQFQGLSTNMTIHSWREVAFTSLMA